MTAVNVPLAPIAADSLRPTSHRQSLANGSTATPPREASDALSTMSSLTDMEARCGGCRNVIDQDNGGIVVAFGSSLWHVDCFRCAKCKEKVSADTNLLLLSDGSPVCGNCSYQCFVCKKAITEEAIMTGDESYHAQCFTCRTCKRRIEELVFAKTTQGIYCMSCHNDRVARSRRHAEAKRQRAARKEREREEAERRRSQDALSQSPGIAASTTSTSLSVLTATSCASSETAVSSRTEKRKSVERAASTSPTAPTAAQRYSAEQMAEQRTRSIDRTLGATSPVPRGSSLSPSPAPSRQNTGEGTPTPGGNRSIPSSPMRTTPAMSRGASTDRETSRSAAGSPTPQTSGSLNLAVGGIVPSPSTPNLGSTSLAPTATRASSGGPGLGISGGGLGVPTSKAEKRRSINPGMMFNMDAQNATLVAEPRAPSPLRASFNDKAQPAEPRSPPAAVNALAQSPSPQSSGEGAGKNRVASPALSSPTMASTSTVASFRTASPVPEHAEEPPTEPSKDAAKKDVPKKEVAKKTSASTVTSPANKDKGEAVDANGENKPLPRIDAPDIPIMSFSLSDPDFAVLLKEMESKGTDSPMKKTKPAFTDSESEPETPSKKGRAGDMPDKAGMPRSHAIDLLANGDQEGGSSGSITPSASRSLLSPKDNTVAAGGTLRRRASAESTLSVRMEQDSAFHTLSDLVATAQSTDQSQVSVDLTVLQDVIREHDALRTAAVTLKTKYSGAKRTSQQYSEGLTVAGEEYDKEVAMRRELEAEVIRLRAQVHSQTARLSVISSDERRAENMRRRSHDLASSLTGLERDIARLRTQRDVSLAEVEELAARKGDVPGNAEEAASKLGRSLTRRLDKIKEEYRDELNPLSTHREELQREIDELRETREQFLEESTSLAAKNEELAELNSQLTRQTEIMQDALARRSPSTASPLNTVKGVRGHPSGSPSMSSLATTALQDVPEETARVIRVPKPEPIEAAPARRFKWIGKASKPEGSGDKLLAVSKGGDKDRKNRPTTEVGVREHMFQQHSTMRLGRCELCQEKMWGLQEVKCASCGIICHSKCADKLSKMCSGSLRKEDDGPLPPSMFGRDLAEQAVADKAPVPVIVTKCIRAVEANGMEYEGIYRKTGGSSQTKAVTQLFERGQYDKFDLTNVDSFNDISAVTSVLKTYFRQLPDPLLTHQLHESFVAAANIRDPSNKHQALCALLSELPDNNYNTLKVLMLHLNRVTAKSEVNLMTSQNLGVVFGPTLLRSSDPGREFGDMAGKALSVQWMVDNAPTVFMDDDE